ncbi:hypothetical protein [Streptacidiphilus rugosus]|uniref:hypothetical protein n=1 Tax=Streptacidiphilus rugosus TaxID=405783 RepID=UPI000AD254F7|nr:hypothetical protein [Streptacidiphilus rugosus]
MPNARLAGAVAGRAAAPPSAPTAASSTAPDIQLRAAVASLLDRGLRLAAGDLLVVVFTADLKEAAVRLTATARRSGALVRLVALPPGEAPAPGRRVRSALRELAAEPETGSGAGRRLVLLLGGAPVDLAALGLPPQLIAAQLPADEDRPGGPLPGWEDPDARAERLAVLCAATSAAGRLRVLTGDGRALQLARRDDRPAVVDPGPPVAGELLTLPAGAVRIEVDEAEGLFVAEGTLQVNRPVRLGGPLRGRPVRLELTGGRVTRLDCPDPHTEGFLRRAVEVHGVDRLRQAWCRPLAAGRPEVGLCLTADEARRGPAGSADLRIVLAARADWTAVPPVPARPARRTRTGEATSEAERN